MIESVSISPDSKDNDIDSSGSSFITESIAHPSSIRTDRLLRKKSIEEVWMLH